MANQVPYATNEFGVRVNPLDFDAPGAPTAMTYHGISIVVDGNVVGRISSWARTAYTRAGVHVYELNHKTFGRPVDYVPGQSTGYTITASRAEVWRQELEIALGFNSVWNDLCDQNRPFRIQEFLYRGTIPYRVWTYLGCWFQDRNEEAFTPEGDAIIRTNSTMAYVSRIRTL